MDPDVILFDEPTSALDPTRVGEVQAHVGKLATTDKTLMIVTHEMAFARAICNRVFYMDKGGICEDGAPEQMFGRPLRARTRRFVRRLKVLEHAVSSRDCDYPDMPSEISRFCERSDISPRQANQLTLVCEELIEQLESRVGGLSIEMMIAYAEDSGRIVVELRHSGPQTDVTQECDPLSITILKSLSGMIDYCWMEHDERPSQIRLTMKSRG